MDGMLPTGMTPEAMRELIHEALRGQEVVVVLETPESKVFNKTNVVHALATVGVVVTALYGYRAAKKVVSKIKN